LTENQQINVLVSPLDWGIGHATRCVPVINAFLNEGCNVIIGASGRSGAFLKSEFPHLEHIALKSFNIKYPKKGRLMLLKMFLQVPYILKATIDEGRIIKQIIKKHKIHIVFSDNRYGLNNKNAYCVFMTHQLMLKMPKGWGFAEKLMHLIIKRFIKKFNECWVPDFEGEIKVSGDLSHKYKIKNTHFIGILSRFNSDAFIKKQEAVTNNFLFLLSGPEPQRSIFENIILSQIKNCSHKVIIVRGITETQEVNKISENITCYTHLPTAQIASLIKQSEITICRSGYSTIMDLLTLKAKALLVPTPGQTEQEYLAAYLNKQGVFNTLPQNDFKLEKLNTLPDLNNKLLIESVSMDMLIQQIKRIKSLCLKNL